MLSLQKAAAEGNGDASWELGCEFEEGAVDDKGRLVVRPDVKRAVAAYKRAARLRSTLGLVALGYCFDLGKGVGQNKRRALECYTTAWRIDKSLTAAVNIATIHRDRGDHARAFRWWQRAANLDDGDALLDIGYLYYYGIGVRRDRAEAMRALHRATESRFISEYGREEALYHLAVAHVDAGAGGDLRQARALLRRAARDGDYPEASALQAQLKAREAPRFCRCRRWWWRHIPGQAECPLHKRPADTRPHATLDARVKRRG